MVAQHFSDRLPLSNMSSRVSALTRLLRSPARILTVVLLIVFTVEVAVMFVLPYLFPAYLGEVGRALTDAILLTVACAPALWWIIIGPLRRIAIQEHQRSQTIVSNASEGILSFDRHSRIASCNRAAARLFRMEADQLIGKSIQLAIPDLPKAFKELPSEYRLEGLRDDGHRIPIHVSVSHYPSESEPQHIAIIRDLTEAQEAEQHRITMARETEALRAQQMATLAQLATGVAHEIRNPLTSIKMLVQVNRARFAEKGLPTADLDLVEQEIRRMERSVNSLLEYARPEKAERCRFDVKEGIHGALKLVEGQCTSQNVTIDVRMPDGSICVTGDPAQFRQMLLNLLLNGLDAMPDGGILSVAVAPSDGQVEITIDDTGGGISEQISDEIFSPFVTTKPGGVGLGLGICRRIAEAHHGTIDATNSDCGGAQFRLKLPLSEPNGSLVDEEA